VPAADISFGWGGGNLALHRAKRHVVKKLELSPKKIAIDRERCIRISLRWRFSQEIFEDDQW